MPQGFSFRTISDVKGNTEKDLIKFFKSKSSYEIEPNYSTSNENIYGILYVTLFQFVLNNKYLIKKCKNCGKYFITDNPRINYCNNLFKRKTNL